MATGANTENEPGQRYMHRRSFVALMAGAASTAILAACGVREGTAVQEATEAVVPSPTPAATAELRVPTIAAPRPRSAPATTTAMRPTPTAPAVASMQPTVPATAIPATPTSPAGTTLPAPATHDDATRAAPDAQAPRNTSLPAPTGAIPQTFFGMHVHHLATTTPWPAEPFGSWRLWDADVAWHNLEPRRGEWHFETLDRYVALAEQHQVEVSLPLGFSPRWASARPNEPSPYYSMGSSAEPGAIEDWRAYVTAVATRYQGRIRFYEVWNEPNLRSYWTGTMPQLLTLTQEAYRILKHVDPANALIGPSATDQDSGLPWLDTFLACGGGEYLDGIAHHLYVFPQPPEALAPFIGAVRRVMANRGVGAKPLWNTEMTWALPKTFATPEEAAAYVARSYLLNWVSGVERCFWYAWDNHEWATLQLTEADQQTPTLAGIAYGEIRKWLVEARIESYTLDQDMTAVCQLTGDGRTGRIIWNPRQSLAYTLPKAWNVTERRDLTGKQTDLRGATHVIVGSMPVLLGS